MIEITTLNSEQMCTMLREKAGELSPEDTSALVDALIADTSTNGLAAIFMCVHGKLSEETRAAALVDIGENGEVDDIAGILAHPESEPYRDTIIKGLIASEWGSDDLIHTLINLAPYLTPDQHLALAKRFTPDSLLEEQARDAIETLFPLLSKEGKTALVAGWLKTIEFGSASKAKALASALMEVSHLLPEGDIRAVLARITAIKNGETQDPDIDTAAENAVAAMS